MHPMGEAHQSAMPNTAIIHYKSIFQHTVVRYSLAHGAAGTWVTYAFDAHTSPIHPFWVVIRLTFDVQGVHFLPMDGRTGGIHVPDGGPAPRFAHQPWSHGAYYVLRRGGTYVLADGELTRFSDDSVSIRDQFGADLPASSARLQTRLSIFLDIDGTLLGGGRMRAFVRLWERSLALRGAVVLFNTGRSEPSVLDFLSATGGAIVPTAAICRVGCEIRWFRDARGWRPRAHSRAPAPIPARDSAWAARLAGAGGWEWRRVLSRVRDPLERRVRARLSEPVTRDRPVPPYTTYVLTFVVRRSASAEAMRIARGALGDIRAKIGVCGNGGDQYLDIINCDAGKLGGMRYVLERLGPHFSPETAVMAGDSGNDIDAFDHNGVEKGIIVGNAEPDLLRFWADLQRRKPNQTRIVRTKKQFAEGICEGLVMLRLI